VFVGNSTRGSSTGVGVSEPRRSRTPTTSSTQITATAVGGNTAKIKQPQKQSLQGDHYFAVVYVT